MSDFRISNNDEIFSAFKQETEEYLLRHTSSFDQQEC